jgi:hypothetical protein
MDVDGVAEDLGVCVPERGVVFLEEIARSRKNFVYDLSLLRTIVWIVVSDAVSQLRQRAEIIRAR